MGTGRILVRPAAGNSARVGLIPVVYFGSSFLYLLWEASQMPLFDVPQDDGWASLCAWQYGRIPVVPPS